MNDYDLSSCYRNQDILNDGSLSASQWRGCPPVFLSFYDGRPVPSGLETEIRSFWTGGYVYFGYQGRFDSLRVAPDEVEVEKDSGKTHRLWELSDVYEVFIGPEARQTRRYREFQVAPDSRWIDIAIDAGGKERKTDFTWKSGFCARSKVEDGIWSAVFQIPFQCFNAYPGEEMAWHCNLYRISGPPGECSYLAWSPVMIVNFHQPHRFGTISFVKEWDPA